MPGVQVPGYNLPYLGQLGLPADQTRPLPWPEKWTGLKWTLLRTLCLMAPEVLLGHSLALKAPREEDGGPTFKWVTTPG